MSNDPQGPDENADPKEFAAAEDFLGLQANSSGPAPEASEPSQDPGIPPLPNLNDGIYDPQAETPPGDGIYDPQSSPAPGDGIYDPELSPAQDEIQDPLATETLDGGEDGGTLEIGGSGSLMDPEPLPSLENSADLDEAGEGFEPETGDLEPGEPGDGADDFELDFDEEGASWLMEFDGAESVEEQEEAFAQAFDDAVDDLEDDFRPSLAEPEMVGGSSPWIGRALLAIVSVAAGVVGSKFFFDGGFGAGPEPTQVAQGNPTGKAQPPGKGAQPKQPAQPTAKVDGANPPAAKQPGPRGQETPPAAKGPKQPAAGGGKPGNKPTGQKGPGALAQGKAPAANAGKNGGPKAPETGSKPGPRAAGGVPTQLASPIKNSGGAKGPAKPGETPGAVAQVPVPEPESPGLVIQVGEGTTGNAGPVDLAPRPEAPVIEEEHGRLRQASSGELSRIWTGDSIPREAVHGEEKILTPAVGDVRVLLSAGEIFEGKLYAVGNRRIWLETKIGKMALLEWQIDSYEKIADSTTMSLGNARTVAGLQSVRVRTAGGVFYGKLVSHEGSTVTILTASGARLTLENAELTTAGRSTSHLVDSSKLTIAEADTPK